MPLKKAGLRRFRTEIGGAVDRGVARAAGYIADLATQLAPYDENANHKHLNESIVVRGEPGSGKRQVVAGDDLPDARAIYQEYGTRDSAAQPYLTPASEAIDVGKEVAAEIEKLARGSTL